MQTGIGIAVGCAVVAISCSSASAPYELPPGSPEGAEVIDDKVHVLIGTRNNGRRTTTHRRYGEPEVQAHQAHQEAQGHMA